MPEISFNDGSYLTEKGNALIGKLLASEGTLKFTKVTAGDGSIPSGKSPEGMTELGNYVTDGLIASVSSSARRPSSFKSAASTSRRASLARSSASGQKTRTRATSFTPTSTCSSTPSG